MVAIKTILILAELTLLSVSVGGIVSNKIIKEELTFLECISEGFVWVLGIFFIIALPFLWFDLPFHILSNLFYAVSLILILSGFKYIRKIKRIFYKNILVPIVLLVILMQMFYSTYMYHEDDDDGYYVVISNLAVEEDQIETDPYIVYNGLYREEQGIGFAPPIVSWELLIACFAKLNNLHPTILAHSVLPIWLIALAYIAAWRIGLVIFRGNNQLKNSMIFLLLYAVLNLFGGFLVRQPACFLLLRIWQGKAIIVSLIFPLVIENCLQIYIGNDKGRWLKSNMLLFAGMMLTSVGMALTLLCYIAYGLPYILYILLKERGRLKTILSKAVISIMPTMIVSMGCFIYVMSQKAGADYSIKEPESWWVWIQVTMGTAKTGYLLLGIIALVIILIRGKREEKMCLVGGTIVALLTFLNPLLSDLVSQKIIGVDVYWRAWWVIPTYSIIAIAFTDLLDRFTNIFIKSLIVLAALSIIIINGKFMYRKDTYFKGYQNIYKIPNEVISLCDFLLERDEYITILVPYDITRKIRQYSTKLYIPMAKYMSVSEIMVPGMDLTYGEVYQAVYDAHVIDRNVYDALKELDVKYIVTREKLVGGGNLIGNVEEMYIWKIE